MPLIIPLQENVFVDYEEELGLITITQPKIDDYSHKIEIQEENLPLLVQYLSALCRKEGGE